MLFTIKTSPQMKRFVNILPFILFSFLIISCESNKTGASRSSGKTAEMIVVINNETKWEGMVGETVRSFFNTDYEVLAQPEPLFEMASIPIANFNKTKMFQSHHNILILDIDKNATEPSMEARKDVWASPQTVINIKAPSDEIFATFFDEKKEKFLLTVSFEEMF